ncbi:hypothetical protein SEA_VANLEE_48 [Gordonia phage VanLee]|uniref:Uncharacterized protein n=1 Tax=Gordonia phage VanLee TaxID=2845816 RepID=A0A8F2DA34_9CAUD|nr:hypothetical protein QEH49_gp048 [Gordonia phage VanLee]QWS68165.1 hypothetical protein SEA_VANLEE_48 [Gordonia phage VanLee]
MRARLALAIPASSFEEAIVVAERLLDDRETPELRFGPPEVMTDPKLRAACAKWLGTTDFYGFVATAHA